MLRQAPAGIRPSWQRILSSLSFPAGAGVASACLGRTPRDHRADLPGPLRCTMTFRRRERRWTGLRPSQEPGRLDGARVGGPLSGVEEVERDGATRSVTWGKGRVCNLIDEGDEGTDGLRRALSLNPHEKQFWGARVYASSRISQYLPSTFLSNQHHHPRFMPQPLATKEAEGRP